MVQGDTDKDIALQSFFLALRDTIVFFRTLIDHPS